jgi:hypothetical protein
VKVPTSPITTHSLRQSHETQFNLLGHHYSLLKATTTISGTRLHFLKVPPPPNAATLGDKLLAHEALETNHI